MKLTPFGAAGGEVTGSCYLLETDQARILIDCGLFQGGKDAAAKNRVPTGGEIAKLDAVVLTHAHLDHTGRLPLLSKAGYTGPIYATPASIEMTGLILRDSAKLQAQDAERTNRKLERAGEPLIEPLYTSEQVERTISLFQPVPYHKVVPIAPGIVAEFIEAGHMLGSACIQFRVQEGERTRRIVFSGDLGPKGAPILKDYERFNDAEVVVLESTYGDREHRPLRETVDEFFEILKSAVAGQGKIMVPTFAVGRAQLLTMLLAYAFRKGIVKPFPIFLDSPMATEAWKIYRAHTELYDDDMVRFLNEGSITRDLGTLQYTITAEESKKINDFVGSCLILAGAGMCNGGRILHHFKQNLWKPENHVVIVGYQAEGTLGRFLVQGTAEVKIFGEKIAVRAKVHTMGGFSAHAGQTDLLNWLAPMARKETRVLLTHGENGPRNALAHLIRERYHIKAHLPQIHEQIEI
jgi:metallo-beta-lactamase family protein